MLFDEIASVYQYLALETASRGNQHCANCTGTLYDSDVFVSIGTSPPVVEFTRRSLSCLRPCVRPHAVSACSACCREQSTPRHTRHQRHSRRFVGGRVDDSSRSVGRAAAAAVCESPIPHSRRARRNAPASGSDLADSELVCVSSRAERRHYRTGRTRRAHERTTFAPPSLLDAPWKSPPSQTHLLPYASPEPCTT